MSNLPMPWYIRGLAWCVGLVALCSSVMRFRDGVR